MASRKKDKYQIQPGIYVPFMLELEHECKIIKHHERLKRYVLGCNRFVHPTNVAAKNTFL